MVKLVEAGDTEGLGGLYDHYGSACLKGAAVLTDTGAGTEDLAFEVFLMMWRDPPPAGVSVRQFLTARLLEKLQQLHG